MSLRQLVFVTRAAEPRVADCARLSQLLVPTTKESDASANTQSHDLLLRGGFIRQSSAGVYSYLPFGLRVLGKLEAIIDEEMESVGGQKVSLPCLLSSESWKATGRWETTGAEMFKVKDRKHSEFLLSPTHEEEITSLVASLVSSHRQLPLRLYQIGRKYRDELRPRSGLLRAREFIMKDMYSFDVSEDAALDTYEQVQGAYVRILKRIGAPFAVAEADTGNIGGSRSHEYHFISPDGTLANIVVVYQAGREVNPLRLKKLDSLLGATVRPLDNEAPADAAQTIAIIDNSLGEHSAAKVEAIGHTFYLGTKYSAPLGAEFHDSEQRARPIVMGCYGIGVSRMIAAIVEASHDGRGIIWPRAIAPFEVCIVPLQQPKHADRQARISAQLDALVASLNKVLGKRNVVVDDRDAQFGFKMNDAALVGYPFVVVIGRSFLERGQIELHSRADGSVTLASPDEIPAMLARLAPSESDAAQGAALGRITVSVGTLTGKTFTLSIFTTNTVGELKYRIFEEEGIPVESQLLVFRDKHLTQDEALVGEFGIQSGSRIQLVLHMAGGPGPPIRTRSQIPEQDNVVFLLCKQNDEIFMLEVHMRQGKTPHTAAKHILRIAQGAAGDKVLQCFDSSECFEISDLGDIDLVFDDASDDVDVDTDPDEEFDLDEFDDSMQDRGASYGSDGDEDGLYSGDLDSVFLHNAIYFDSRGSSVRLSDGDARFCAVHRYSDRHECSFDYKEAGKEALMRDNPLVKRDKLVKL
nr:hypothetical protein HK105_000336 [Polyrhizophydium stewartii]